MYGIAAAVSAGSDALCSLLHQFELENESSSSLAMQFSVVAVLSVAEFVVDVVVVVVLLLLLFLVFYYYYLVPISATSNCCCCCKGPLQLWAPVPVLASAFVVVAVWLANAHSKFA